MLKISRIRKISSEKVFKCVQKVKPFAKWSKTRFKRIDHHLLRHSSLLTGIIKGKIRARRPQGRSR